MPEPLMSCSLLQPLPTVAAALVAVIGVTLSIWYNKKAQWNRDETTARVTAAAVKSDIRSITLALEETGIVQAFIKAYETGTLPPWVDAPRKSNYFQLYGAVAPQIGTLPLGLAQESVRFYTFLKVSRDAAEPLGSLREKSQENDVSTVKQQSRNVLVSLRDCMDAAAFVLEFDILPEQKAQRPTKVLPDVAKKLRDEIESTLNPPA